MIKIILCLIIVLILYFCIIKSYNNLCNRDVKVNIDRIFASKIQNIDLSYDFSYPAIYIKLDKDIPCGIYNGTSEYGDFTLLVGKYTHNYASINFTDFNDNVNSVTRFELLNLQRNVNASNDIVATYNIGCCS